MLAKYKLKKKFYRLKNGAFLQLQDSEEVELLDKLITGTDIDYKELENGTVRLPINRTLYLNQLLKKMKNTEITFKQAKEKGEGVNGQKWNCSVWDRGAADHASGAGGAGDGVA